MLRSRRFEVAALGASFLFALAPLTYAEDDPPPTPRATVLDAVPQRSAAERWQRLKSQYAPQPAPRIEQPTRRNTGNGSDAGGSNTGREPGTFKAIPASSDAGTGTAKSPFWQPATSTGAKPAILSAEKAPEWAVPVPTSPNDLNPEESTTEEDSGLSDKDASGLPSPEDSVRPSPANGKEPETEAPDPRGRPRSIGPIRVPPGPARQSTQVRRISDIAPLNDLDRDQDIRDFAAEKAREFNVKFGGDKYTPRNFPDVAMLWEEPRSKYYPLYFQDPALERYGHTYHPLIQPVASAARMSAQLAFLPYQMSITPPWELQSPLGWYRPGDVVPKLHYQIPWNAKAAAVEAATVTGLYFLIQ